MTINVTKLLGEDLLRWACSMTTDADSNMSLEEAYRCEHSPMRTQLFKVELIDLPSFVSVHFVRHATVGQLHFVKSLRSDRGGNNKEDRWTPVNHGMILNAQHLIDMSRRRLCYKSHIETLGWMTLLKIKVGKVDPWLERRMIPECMYRGGVCHEQRPCGLMNLGGDNASIQNKLR